MADYTKDPEGRVHVMLPYGDQEFTLCSRDTTMADSGGFEGEVSGGPANCPECLAAYVQLRQGLKGARFARRLAEPMAAE